MMRSNSKTVRGVWLIALAVLLVLGSCSDEATRDEWTAGWQQLLEEIPTLDTMLTADADTARALCSETLGALRDAASDLQRTPDADLETAAFAFVDFTEGVFFECPLHSAEHSGWEEGYAEMAHLQAAVEALLEG